MLLLLGCMDEVKESILPGCGNGVVEATESCDNGSANSDTLEGACRSNCQLASCGDGVVDPEESCDDGERWGGDGCNPDCALETGAAEQEPNEDLATASPYSSQVNGALPEQDIDCFTINLVECGAVRVEELYPCDVTLLFSLYNPRGEKLAVGGPGENGCSVLDPISQVGARWVEGGDWTVCVEAINGAEVRGYSLLLETPTSESLAAPPVGGDIDADQVPDSCDVDMDADGLVNEEDNCPEISNGPDTPALALPSNGVIETWLGAGPFTSGVSSGECRPSLDLFVGEDQPITASLGDSAGSTLWLPLLVSGGWVDLLVPYGYVGSPREAYTLVYLYSDRARSLTLAVGADDGVFGWWNGSLVLDISSCQGVNLDQFQVPVEVVEGWNSLLLKIYDQGGGWGLVARFFENGNPVNDLIPSLTPGSFWAADQSDQDQDGLGDLCDPEP